MVIFALLGVPFSAPAPVPVPQDVCSGFREVTLSSCASMSHDRWLVYTAYWRMGSSYCRTEKSKFDDAWSNDRWVIFGDGTKWDPETGRVKRIGGFHERSSHRSGVTKFTSDDKQMQLAIHESLHHRYRAWNEFRVKREIKKLMDRLCIPRGQVISF